MTFVPASGVLNAVVAAGPVAGAMGLWLFGLLALSVLIVVLGAERTRPIECPRPVVVLRRTPPDDRAAAA